MDLPGLDEEGAAALVRFARDTGICELASAVDPELSLTLHIDRATAEALDRAISDGETDRDDDVDVILQGISEDVQDWLSAADSEAGS